MSRSRTPFTQRSPVPIAVIGLAAIVGLLVLVTQFQKLPFIDDSSTYEAVFTDASGLAAGEEVRVAGIKVGVVQDITLEQDQVVVEFTVSGVELGDDTEAGIEVKSLLGQHYLSVTPIGSGALPDGARIPLERTATPLNIVPAFNRLAKQTAATDTDQVADAFDALAETLSSTAPELQGALTGLSRISRSVTTRDDEIETLFRRADEVTGIVAERDVELGELLTASDQVLETLAERRRTITRIIDGTVDLARELEGLVDDNRAALKPALDDLDRVLQVLRANADNLDETLAVTAVYAREFTNVGGTGPWFDASIKLPRGAALCSTNDSTAPLGDLFDPVLSELNQAVNDSATPCLPLGPAIASRLAEGQVPSGKARR
ncbi:MAG: MCE family protein [Nocardioides sp.]